MRTRSWTAPRLGFIGTLNVSVSDVDRPRPSSNAADREQRNHQQRQNPPTGKAS
jgi:hypothetical protein